MAEKMKPSGIDWIGNIPNDWKIQRFKFCGAVLFGYPFNSDFFTNEDTGIPLIRIRDITSGTISTYYEGHYSAEYMVHSGDVLVGMDGDFNVRIWDNLDALLNQRCCKILSSKKINARYLAYYLPHQLYIINQLTWSTTVKHLLAEDIGNIPVAYPQLNEQQAIVRLLDKECTQIDSIAANLERQIALLQQYKKSLITETVTKGLDKSVPMKDSGVKWIGKIPEHWEISRVKHLASLCSGATPSKDVLSYWEGNIPWVSSQEVKSDIIKDTSLHISEEAINSCSTQLMPAGTLVMVVRSGILQHTIPVALLGVPATINQDIKAFQFNHLMLPAYFKYYIQGENDALLSVIIKDKTTVESVDNQLLLSLKIMVPPIEEQKAIVAFLNYKCGYIDKILNDKQEQLNLLMQHKKSLIYEYVTGKKRVKEVQ